MEGPLFIARDPRIYAVQYGAPLGGRVFVVDQGRWYERLKDDNGNAKYAFVADSEEEFQRTLVEQDEPPLVELDIEDAIATVALDEFSKLGTLYPEVPVVEDMAA
ncbi:MAG: hypothetical protein WD645_06750 [Dehalococcoidia bacterium]